MCVSVGCSYILTILYGQKQRKEKGQKITEMYIVGRSALMHVFKEASYTFLPYSGQMRTS